MSDDFLDSDELKVERLEAEIDRLTRELETRTNSLKSLGESYAPLVQERDRLRAALERIQQRTLQSDSDAIAREALGGEK